MKIDLFYDPPELVVSRGAGGEPAAIAWERLAPGHFGAAIDAGEEEYVRGAIRLGDEAIPFGPLNVGTKPEWSFDRSRLDEVSAVSYRSGGEKRVDLSDVWQAPRPTAFRGLRRWLLPLLLAALTTQTGWTPSLTVAAAPRPRTFETVSDS